MKVLCRENCKGICNRCGANLNLGSCKCDDAELDPRMSKILDIFNQFKESETMSICPKNKSSKGRRDKEELTGRCQLQTLLNVANVES